MTAIADDVRAQADELARLLRENGAHPNDAIGAAEQELLRRLGALMKNDESCFDPVNHTARILEGTDTTLGVRLDASGEWKVGSAPEEDLVAAWSRPSESGPARPTLRALLLAIPRSFASAKVGAIVDEVRATLYPDAISE